MAAGSVRSRSTGRGTPSQAGAGRGARRGQEPVARLRARLASPTSGPGVGLGGGPGRRCRCRRPHPDRPAHGQARRPAACAASPGGRPRRGKPRWRGPRQPGMAPGGQKVGYASSGTILFNQIRPRFRFSKKTALPRHTSSPKRHPRHRGNESGSGWNEPRGKGASERSHPYRARHDSKEHRCQQARIASRVCVRARFRQGLLLAVLAMLACGSAWLRAAPVLPCPTLRAAAHTACGRCGRGCLRRGLHKLRLGWVPPQMTPSLGATKHGHHSGADTNERSCTGLYLYVPLLHGQDAQHPRQDRRSTPCQALEPDRTTRD